ncbi:Uma2 family endonuclease [Leptolyngbya cf. ectocarpi LEGE 11479]|uniref:Uma2 family endonuclease n=1 Tax=Leptolyngbya cf. ectocarpi LEGE 11479 TaxID=1828722 RepID=A0A928ZYQ8_LEPEC|nr:Uma2 family endonuclease [Leptolyngbya ectocarpi]MBE9069962.1 Uma2 family endonuclease [Leptolyngbya cf. ectocarpi LEGE 11479]
MVALPQHLTVEDYLQLEAESPIKHEYIDGQVYAMAGASDSHATISLNLASLLRSHVRGTGCRAYMSDMKAQIEARNRFFYPDVMVTCDPRDQNTPMFKRFPKLVVEVLSKSTEAYDRGDKFLAYQALESLQEYVLINTRHQRVEIFRRNDSGLWVLQSYTSGNKTFDLKSIDFTGSFAELYEDVVLEPSEIPEEVRVEDG